MGCPAAAVVLAAALAIASPRAVSAQPRSSSGSCNAAAPGAVTEVKLPGHPFGIAATSDGCRLFVSVASADPMSNGIAVLRRDAGAILLERVVPIAAHEGRPVMRPGPNGIVLTHDGRLLIAANDEEILFLDVPSMVRGDADPIVGRMTDGKSAGSFYVNVTRDDRLLFVSDEHAGTITVVDLEKARRSGFGSDATIGRIPVGVAAIALTFSPDEKWLYTTSEVAPAAWNWPIVCPPDRVDRARFPNPEVSEGAVIVVDVERASTDPAGSIVAKAPAGCSAVRLAMSPDGRSAWVSARRSDAVVGFDAVKLRTSPLQARIGAVPVGTSPVGIAALPDGRHVVVANSNRIAANPNRPQTVSVIDARKVRDGAAAVIGTIAVGAFPREFSLSPDGRTLFLGNYLSDTLSVIDLARLSSVMVR